MLGLAGRSRGAEGVGRVGVAGELAPGSDRARAVFPVEPGDGVAGRGSEGFDGPLRRVGGDLRAELPATGVGRFGPAAELLLPLGRGDGRDHLRVRRRDRGEPVAVPVDDPPVQDLGDGPGTAEVAFGDGGGEDLVRIVAGELGAAEQAAQRGDGLGVGGEREALVGGQRSFRGQAVEACGRPGRVDELGLGGEALDGSLHRRTPCRRLVGLRGGAVVAARPRGLRGGWRRERRADRPAVRSGRRRPAATRRRPGSRRGRGWRRGRGSGPRTAPAGWSPDRRRRGRCPPCGPVPSGRCRRSRA